VSKLYVEEDKSAIDYDPRIESPLSPEFVADIRASGVRLSLVVRRTADGRYKVVDGKTRFRAALAAGLALVPCHVVELDDRMHLRTQVALNAHRTDDELGAQISNARRLLDAGFTRAEIALAFCKPESTIGTLLDVDSKISSPEVRALVEEGAIGLGAAQVIADAAPAVQQQVAESIRDLQQAAVESPDGKASHVTGSRKGDAVVTKRADGSTKVKASTGAVKSLRDAAEKSAGGEGMKSAPVNRATKPSETVVRRAKDVARVAAASYTGEQLADRAFARGVEYALRFALGESVKLPDGSTAANVKFHAAWEKIFGNLAALTADEAPAADAATAA
jgi:ParB/RepB/Spo0J family partition protein